ncbi:nickel-responsive transcriptional regulator NikR [Piscinibacter sakaiensis]|uniref:Putative nickel-responsive regulator n=1 Tax=Piscinibacter sakaiensis TaxID=1547922 RepID=A0A0K8P8K0_PISS1|nr:nickel-responsive transcriptional regulator NikR [Piscinibacter sakaiensis]GAP38834.1 nickel responsive regulator NikR [Piscinibacter sakaiensis]
MERFTISLDDALAQAFDRWIAERAYANRSEAVRDLLRAELERAHQDSDAALHCVASLSYVYNHHERDLAERLTALQHAHHDLTVASMHAHLDHEHCLETVLLRGPARAVRSLADALCAQRGVHHGKLNLISVEVEAAADAHGAPGHGPAMHAAAAPDRPGGAAAHTHAPPPAEAPHAHAQLPHLHLRPLR